MAEQSTEEVPKYMFRRVDLKIGDEIIDTRYNHDFKPLVEPLTTPATTAQVDPVPKLTDKEQKELDFYLEDFESFVASITCAMLEYCHETDNINTDKLNNDKPLDSQECHEIFQSSSQLAQTFIKRNYRDLVMPDDMFLIGTIAVRQVLLGHNDSYEMPTFQQLADMCKSEQISCSVERLQELQTMMIKLSPLASLSS